MKTGNLIISTERLISSVWTLIFQVEDNGINIIHYSRDIDYGYENEKLLLKHKLIENNERVIEAVEINNIKYNVLNKKHIFDYNFR